MTTPAAGAGTTGTGAAWSMRTRLAAVSVVAVTVGLSVAGAAAYVVTARTLHQQVDASLDAAPFGMSDDGPVMDADLMCEQFSRAPGASPGQFTVTFASIDGRLCADGTSSSLVLRPEDTAPGAVGTTRLRDGELSDGTPVRVAVVPVDQGTLLFARDVSTVERVLEILRYTLLVVVLAGVALALVVSRAVAKAGLRPIAEFAAVAEDIAATGNLAQHAQPRGPVVAGRPGDELDRLAHAFNQMTSVLVAAEARQRRLVADAGHELRTPMSSLRANIALLRRSRAQGRPLPEGEEDRMLADLDTQGAELSRLMDDLVELASSERETSPHLRVRLDAVVEEALARARARAEGHAFEVALQPWEVLGDEPSLQRAVVNLLDNALKFSPPGTLVEVGLEAGVVTVEDRGRGLALDEQDRVFERFWRAPAARGLPGSGLGLSIVEDVAAHHGGWATLEPRSGGGSRASLFVPGHVPDASPDTV